MTPDEILSYMSTAAADTPGLETAPFLFSPSRKMSYMTVGQPTPFVWANTDGLVSFTELDTSRTYKINLKIICNVAEMDIDISSDRLLLQCGIWASNYMQNYLGDRLKMKGKIGLVQYRAFYKEGADIFTGYEVTFDFSVKAVCLDNDSFFLLPDGGRLLLPD